MKLLTLTLFFFVFAFSLSGQEGAEKMNEHRTGDHFQKEVVIHELETQFKSIPYAAIRVCLRYKLAEWLLKDGHDETGRGEQIAVSAIEDNFQKRAEIPFSYSCAPQLFVLLQSHSKDVAQKLVDKYQSGDESSLIPALLAKEGGDRLAVDAALRSLSGLSEQRPDLVYLLMRLDQQGSPEIYRVLSAILSAEESGRSAYPTGMIEIFSTYFIKPDVPAEIQRQFLRMIVMRSLNVMSLTIPDQGAYYRMMQRLLPEISTIYPELLPEAAAAHSILSSKVTRETREANERHERIRNSADKLAATVAEAERAKDAVVKYSLYTSAARLALNDKKFVYAVDLMEKASEIDLSDTSVNEPFRVRMHDEFYRDVVVKALEAMDPNAATYAIAKMTADLSKAESLRHMAQYFIKNDDLDSARRYHDRGIRLISNVQSSTHSITTLIKMLPNAQGVDPGRVFEVNRLIARGVNAIPSPDVADRPGTENYQTYVTDVLTINWMLLKEMTSLVKENRNAVMDLANRVEKKEVKIATTFVLLTEPIGDNLLANEEAELLRE